MPSRSSHTSARTLALLQWECGNIRAFLGAYSSCTGATRRAMLDDSGEFIRVLGMPLPAGYRPESCDLVVIVNDFPARPPYGLYMLSSDRAQVRKIEALFGRFHVARWSTPEAIPGYTWICYHYSDHQWCYRPDAPAQGDNLRKFLQSFYAELEAGSGNR